MAENLKQEKYEALIQKQLKALIRKENELDKEKFSSKSKHLGAVMLDKVKVGIMSKLPNEEIIEQYTKGIGFAATGSEELAKLYANRSAILSNDYRYQDSLKDIKRALDIGYPDKLKAKLYLRRARNLLSIDNKMRPEVEEAMREARKWMDEMDVNEEKKINEGLVNLKKTQFKKLYKKNFDYRVLLPGVSNNNNNHSNIISASGLSIKYSSEQDIYIEATRNLKSGDSLLEHKAYASVLNTVNLSNHCSYCLKRIYSGIPCLGCTQTIYCDEDCRDKAWTEYHDIECSTFNAVLNGDTYSIHMLLSLRLTVKALKESGTVDGLIKQIHLINSVDDPITKRLTKGVFDSSKYRSVYTLTGWEFTSEEMINYSWKSAKVVYYLAKFTEIFGKKISSLRELFTNKSAIFVGGLILRHICIVKAHSCARTFNRKCGKFDYCQQLFPVIDYFSHSCNPNAYVLYVEGMCVLYVLSPIKEKEKVTISYGPNLTMNTAARKKELMRLKNFDCKCIACVKNWGPNFNYPRLEEQDLPPEVKRRLIHYQTELKDQITTGTHVVIVRSSSHVDQYFNSLLEKIKYINNAINIFSLYDLSSCFDVLQWKDYICAVLDTFRESIFHQEFILVQD